MSQIHVLGEVLIKTLPQTPIILQVLLSRDGTSLNHSLQHKLSHSFFRSTGRSSRSLSEGTWQIHGSATQLVRLYYIKNLVGNDMKGDNCFEWSKPDAVDASEGLWLSSRCCKPFNADTRHAVKSR